MASPVSIGDAILLAKIALKVGKAFRGGAKAAPAEFYQIQSLLVSISESLSAIHDIATIGSQEKTINESSTSAKSRDELGCGGREPPGNLLQAVHSTRAVLKTVEDFIAKYSILNNEQKPKTAEGLDLRFTLKRSWRSVLWSKDAGEVARLRTILVDHANSLSLMITATKWGDELRSQKQVDTMQKQLDEIHEWFTSNLEDKKQHYKRTRDADVQISNQGQLYAAYSFALYEEGPGHTIGKPNQSKLICPTAAFIANSDIPNEALSNKQEQISFIRCTCPRKQPSSRLGELIRLNHSSNDMEHPNVLSYTLIPVSILVQLATTDGRIAWQIFVQSSSTSSTISLVIENVPPANFVDLELQARDLGLRTSAIQPVGFKSALVHRQGNEAMILRMRSNTTDLTPRLLSVSFHANGTTFKTPKPSAINMLHYSSLRMVGLGIDADLDKVTGTATPAAAFMLDVVAGDQLVPTSSNSRYSLQIDQSTEVSMSRGPRFLSLFAVKCTEILPTEQDGTTLACDEVTLEFTDSSAALDFMTLVKDMQQKLLLSYIQGPRMGESIVYQSLAGEVMVGSLILKHATFTVISSLDTGRCRVAIVRSDRSAGVCFELTGNLLQTASAGVTMNGMGVSAVWMAEISQSGVRITKEKSISFQILPLLQDGNVGTSTLALS